MTGPCSVTMDQSKKRLEDAAALRRQRRLTAVEGEKTEPINPGDFIICCDPLRKKPVDCSNQNQF